MVQYISISFKHRFIAHGICVVLCSTPFYWAEHLQGSKPIANT